IGVSCSAQVRNRWSRFVAMPDSVQSRRGALAWMAAGVAVPVLAGWSAGAQAKTYKVSYTDAQWKQRLTSAQYAVLRQEHTERPFSSPLDKEKRKGTFV